MRYLVIFGLIFFNFNVNYAQDFAPTGAKWYYTEGYAFSNSIGFFELTVKKDTVIKGIDCKMIVKNKIQNCSTRPRIEYMYENDSNEVYFYDSEFDCFQKLWDFNPKINESWSIKLGDIDTLITYIVDSISQININGQNLRQFYVTYQFHGNDYEYFTNNSTIIENIGDVNYFFPWNNGACDANYAEGLRCYSDSKYGDYSTGITEACNYTYNWTSIHDLNQNPIILVYPNPTSGYVELKNIVDSHSDLRFSIIDINGRLVISKKLIYEDSIDLSMLVNGLYTIKLYQGKDMIGVAKVIKQ